MKISNRLTAAALAGLLGAATLAPFPAAADGAASTRNILFGAAAVGGTLLIVNHNKKIHEKYAEYDQRQAETQAEANQAQAAYESERRAYVHEAALVDDYRHEVAYQHSILRQRERQVAFLEHSLRLAKANGRSRTIAFVRPPALRNARHRSNARHAPVQRSVAQQRAARPAQVVSYGWGTYDGP